MADQPIPPAEWRTIVEHVPIVSVDLVITHEGGVLLGRRANDPAKGEWFVPGGTVLKTERRREAVHRVAREELGVAVTIADCLGTYEHFYETADVPGVDSKHYLATAYHCHLEDAPSAIAADAQHSDLAIFSPPFDSHHPYVERYLDELF